MFVELRWQICASRKHPKQKKLRNRFGSTSEVQFFRHRWSPDPLRRRLPETLEEVLRLKARGTLETAQKVLKETTWISCLGSVKSKPQNKKQLGKTERNHFRVENIIITKNQQKDLWKTSFSLKHPPVFLAQKLGGSRSWNAAWTRQSSKASPGSGRTRWRDAAWSCCPAASWCAVGAMVLTCKRPNGWDFRRLFFDWKKGHVKYNEIWIPFVSIHQKATV